MLRVIAFTLLFFVPLGQNLLAQCATGSEPECSCGGAPVLCTVDQLDNYVFTMSSFQHPQDGPDPLCNNGGGIPNNPTWFAFTAWCTDLTLNASFSNCVAAGGFIGVQIAVYGDCNYTNQVACNVAPGNCNTNDKTLVMNGLTIGNVYYFLVDGCLGSYCTVSIDVVGTCGMEMIDPWTLPIVGETEVCVGDVETYIVEDLAGAATFHWFIGGVEMGQTSNPNYTITWDTPGTYQLCVDASNDPCVPITDPPPQLCTTITVSEADAGMITATPASLCPGEISSFSVSGYTMSPNNTQVILITDAAGVILDIIPGDMGTYTSNTCQTISVCSYNYVLPGSQVPVIGDNINTIDCSADCCDLVCTNIVFEDTVLPVFSTGPMNLTLSCFDLVPAIADLTWTDNCDETGIVTGVETGSADICNGGTLTRTWEYTDMCNNTGNHIQTITIDPMPLSVFINPPADATIDCSSIPTSAPDLIYNNSGPGGCLIEGFVSPVETGSADFCGGTITYTWTFTDACTRTITHTQNLTVDPVPLASFINPPASMTVDCDNIPTGPGPDLSYTNNETGTCAIMGMITPVESGSADICGGTITYTWDYIDDCGRPINHVQNITVTPAPPAAFVNPPTSMTVDCDNIPTSASDLSYTNNGAGTCLISGMIAPVTSGSADICGGTITYTWDYVDNCGRPINHVQNITVTPADPPTFINPPASTTVDCNNIPTGSGPDLAYTNNGPGACEIMGMITPVQSGSADVCGGTITYTWDYTDDCGRPINHVQNITVTPADPPVFINPPANITVSCDAAPTSAPDLMYSNSATGTCLIEGMATATPSGSFDECGGELMFTWEANSCGSVISYTQTITVDPAPPATFTGPFPPDMTVDCENVPGNPGSLSYTNNQTGDCEIAGSVPAVPQGSYDECGGELTYNWEFIDNCGTSINYQQIITVTPAPPATFINPPGPATLACSAIGSTPPVLSYSNNQSGVCNISGTIVAIQSGSYDECGGNITYSWVFTDDCNRPISHSQVVTVTPASDPMFVNPPQDVTINCGEPYPFPIDLPYTNGETGNCEIAGTVPAIVIVISPLQQEYQWTFTNPCNGFTILHTQLITQTPEPDIVVTPNQVTICEGASFDLTSISVIDQNGTNPTITFHSGSPANLGNQLGNTTVMPLVSTTYYVLATNAFGCSAEAPFDIEVETPPNAGISGNGFVCYELSSSVDLFSFLNGSPDLSGQWFDNNGYGVNVSNPYNVNLFGLPPGTYTFDYVVFSTGVCPDAMSSVTIELLPEIDIDILDISCTGDPNFYEVLFNGNGFSIVNSGGGMLNDLGSNQYSITNIPIGNTISIIALNPLATDCFNTISISPPDCDCPTVDPPVSNGNKKICEGETIPELSVTVGPNETANWYSVPTGGTALVTASLTYTPTNPLPGLYEFYVETENINDGCLSSLRTLITLEIVENPTGVDVQLEKCDDNQDGFVLFDLTEAEALISSSPGFTFQYFETLANAQSGTNPLSTSYTNTSTPTQDLFVVLQNSDTCTAIVTLTLLVHLPPDITLQISNERCLGDNDGSVTVSNPTGATYSLDSITWTSINTFNGLAAGTYTMFVENGDSCIASQNFTISPGMELILSVFDLICDNNGTASDSTDDFYNINFTLNNSLSISGTYSVNDGTMGLGSFSYGTSKSFTVPANGQSFTLTFTDDTRSCTITQAVGPLNSCSTDCSISIDLLDIVCSDNGTDTDPTDDIYTISINASAVNGAANNTYNVLINSALSYNFPYGIVSTFTLPANGISPVITVVDNADAQCSASQTIGPLTPCSDNCIVTAVVSNVQCDNTGTGTDSSDDTYTFDLLVTGVNVSTTWNATPGSISGTYGALQNLGPYLISDGDQILTITDAFDLTCPTTVTATAPATCSNDCEINITTLDINCNDNGTVSNQTDDYYEITIDAAVINGGGTGNFEVFVNSVSYGIFAYGTGGIITLPADGTSPTIEVSDETELTCTASQNIGPLDPCTDACTIGASLSNIQCDDSGTNDPTDDTYTFDLLVTGQNTSANWQIAGGGTSGSYGTVTSFGPFLISGGDQILDIEDTGNPACAIQVTATAPASCSPTCIISITNLEVNCNDNGTLSNQTDDYYEVTINASVISGGATGNFEVFVNSASYGVFAYGVGGIITLPANGSSPTIEIRDETETTCVTSQFIGPLDPCTGVCTISASVSNIQCDDEGTNDPSDDTYTFDILVSGQNTSTNWQITGGGTTGNYGTIISFGPYLISGGDQILNFEDTGNATCMTQVTATAPASCSPTCAISIVNLNLICNDNGTVSDLSDDYYEVTIDASVLNGGPTGNFEVLVNSVSEGTFAYGLDGSFNLPADGTSPIIEIRDETEITCVANQMIGPLDPCNGACTISAVVSNIQCNDEGTNDPADDTYTFDLLVNGQNTSTTWQTLGAAITGTYGTVVTLGPFLISGGDQILNLEDSGNAACNTQATAIAPASCSPTCAINIATLNVFCNDNGTLSQQNDDYYEITIDATVMNGGSTNNFEVFVNSIYAGTFAYSTGGTITHPADASSPVIEIRDETEITCTDSQMIGPLDPCNPACVLQATVLNILCDNNGTGDNSSDDTYTFEIVMVGQNTSGQWQLEGGGLSGNYGELVLAGPYLISDGDQVLTLEDMVNPDCETVVTAKAPMTCSSCLQTVDAGAGFTITCADTTGLLQATSSDFGNYEWTLSGASVGNDLAVNVEVSGTYLFTATYPDACVAIDSVVVGLDIDSPVVNPGPDRFLTCDTTEITLDGTMSSMGMDYVYEWTNDLAMVLGTEPELLVNTAGNYFLQVTDTINGCRSNIEEVIVLDSTANPLALILADPGVILDCVVGSIVLYTNPEPNIEYTWTQLGGSVVAAQITITEPGVIVLTATNMITGCESTDQIVVTDLEDYPIIDIETPNFISCYDSQVVIDATNSQSNPNIIYNWYTGLNILIPGENTDTLAVDQGGVYILQLLDTLNGCENFDTVMVESFLEVPLSQAAEDVELPCLETATNLDLDLLSDPNDLNIVWTSNTGTIVANGTTPSPSVIGTGIYTVWVQNIRSGCVLEDSLEVTNNPDVPRIALVNVNAEKCLGASNGSLVVENIAGGTAPYSYVLNNSPVSNSGTFSPLAPGFYDLEITDARGCRLDTSFVIDPGVDLTLSLPSVIELLLGESGLVEAIVNVPEEDLEIIQWNPEDNLSCDTCLTTTILALGEEQYVLSVVHQNGCLATASLQLFVRPQVNVFIPNGFSPNGNGTNDNFTLYANERVVKIERMLIFDRWGEEVFQGNNIIPSNPAQGWDGTFRGKDLNPTVFVYVFEVLLDDGSREVFSGDVTLVK